MSKKKKFLDISEEKYPKGYHYVIIYSSAFALGIVALCGETRVARLDEPWDSPCRVWGEQSPTQCADVNPKSWTQL